MMKFLTMMFLVAALSLTVLAQSEFKGQGDGIETCPVTGEKLTSKEIKGEFFGRTVYFCCGGCLAKAQKEPALYVKKTEKEQLAAVAALAKPQHAGHDHGAAQAAGKFLGKGDGVETCPVTGEALTSKNVKGEFFGRTVYFCCEGCLATAKKNPELYVRKEAPKTETAFLGKGDGVETCPVTGTPVDKSVKAEINGKTVYFCCAGCVDTVKKNPAAYLK
jgi:YHS domain-containing protein